MATGDQNDIFNRLKALLPPTWFDSTSPFLDGVLTACSQALAWCYSLYVYAKLQTRISTATDGWLDLAAYDYFGNNMQRAAGQSDDLFRNQMKISLFRERGTRQAIIDILEDMTGKTPYIFEPQRPMDTGAYGAAVAVTRSTTATYVDLSGILRTAQPNQVRYDANPYATAMNGLMIEAAATNIVPYSINIGSYTWIKQRASAYDYSTVSPDGDMRATIIIPGTENNSHYISSPNITCSASSDYTFSVYVKGGGYTQLRIRASDTVSLIRECVFDTATGSFIVGASFSTATKLANGWYRISFTTTTSSSATYLAYALWVYSAGAQVYSGDGVSGVYVYGAQVEAGGILSSFIPTYASAVTRAADLQIDNMTTGSTFSGGYDLVGGYGSLMLAYQAFVTAYRPSGSGIPYIAGYSSTPSGYSTPSRGEYASQSMITGSITDAQVYEAIAAVKMEGTLVWVRLQ